MMPALVPFIKKIFIILLLVVVCDRAIGWGLEKLFYAQKHGDNFVTLYMLEKPHEQVLIFGGSRASHNFNSDIIEAGTHMSCFNGGRDEMTIDYTAALLPIVYTKDTPKIAIIEILPTELADDPKNKVVFTREAAALMPFCNKYPALLPTVARAGASEIIKMKLSRIYPYNSTFASSIQNSFTHLGHHSIKGYEPLTASIDSATYIKPIWNDFAVHNWPVDTGRQATLQHIIDITKRSGTRLIVIVSPFYFPTDFYNNNSYRKIREMISANGGEFYDFSHDPRFLKVPSLFNDDVHLNDSGAGVFTRIVVALINNR